METNDDLPRSDERAIAVRLRDDERCRICNRSKAENPLEVHEIVSGDDEAANKLANYVLLCQEHHRKAHENDRRSSYAL